MPEVEKYSPLITTAFIRACTDYEYLLNRGFPERGVLKLTGDRYRLDGDQRTILYRGISSKARSDIRHAMLVNSLAGAHVLVDGYNVLFTLLNYRLGKPVFICTDGMVRDAGAMHGRLRNQGMFSECVHLLFNTLAQLGPAGTTVYLDSPVSHSRQHAAHIREVMQRNHLPGECFVVQSADWALKQHTGVVIATSDTAVMEKAGAGVVDLPRQVLDAAYGAEYLNLVGLLAAGEVDDTVDNG